MSRGRKVAFATVLLVMAAWTIATALLLALLKTPACGGEACERAAEATARFVGALPLAWVVAMVVGSLLLFALQRGGGPR